MDETKYLQERIRKRIRELGWTLASAAEAFRCETSNTDAPEERRRYREAFKKHLTRPSTKPEKLEKILEFLDRQKDGKQKTHVVPTFVPGDAVDGKLLDLVRDISKALDRTVRAEGNGE